MSVLVIEVVDKGIIFAADRNITTFFHDGTSQQSQEPKVLKFPNCKAIIGYVGEARIRGISTYSWLKTFIEKFQDNSSIQEISEELAKELTKIWQENSYSNSPEPLLIHIGGFKEEKEKFFIPTIWFIRNVYDMSIFSYKDFKTKFECSDEFINIYSKRFSQQFKDRKIYFEEIRDIIKIWSKQLNPFWFHHGFDLITFNLLQSSLDSAFKILASNHPNHEIPKELIQWEKYLRFQILMYGAYFEAFYEEGKRFVGGVDIETIPWPE